MKIQRYKIVSENKSTVFDTYLDAFQSGKSGKVMHLLCDNKTWAHVETFNRK